ncbi:hypothetical protein PoB_005156100 [Plakobranchus ocellatus]|uniref:Uncharacterized protein n=1 Tax=Plakobranchus ocellatus TaxID=259542 RepID=A0AAV4BX12_9GAST|nr:hypothetical protein PoB_005156100 [Plakobranchus ocellatus]
MLRNPGHPSAYTPWVAHGYKLIRLAISYQAYLCLTHLLDLQVCVSNPYHGLSGVFVSNQSFAPSGVFVSNPSSGPSGVFPSDPSLHRYSLLNLRAWLHLLHLMDLQIKPRRSLDSPPEATKPCARI